MTKKEHSLSMATLLSAALLLFPGHVNAQLLPMPGVLEGENFKRINNIFKEIGTTPQGHAGDLVPALLESLSTVDKRAMSEVYQQLREVLPDPSVIYALVQALKSDKAELASGILSNGRNYGCEFDLTNTEIQDVIVALGSENATIRKNLAQLLGHITPPSDNGIHAALIRLLTSDTNSSVRAIAAQSLGNIGREAYFKNTGPIAEAFAKALLSDPSPQVRSSVASGLSQMGGKAHPAAKALTKALTDNSSQVRYQVVQTITNIGPACVDAIDELIDLYNSPGDQYRHGNKERVIQALAAIGPAAAPKAVPLIIPMLKDRSTAATAARTLASFGPAAEKAVPALISMLDSPFYYDRTEAARALGAIGPKAREALQALRKATSDERHAEGEHNSANGAKQAAREALYKITGTES